ncbi:MAG: hypothetical protein RLY45_758, partial [Actinomycetota bacterium]
VTVLAGTATLGLLIAAAEPLRAVVAGRASRVVGWISSRSLSIYLWQGLGLFAADALIAQRGVGGAAGAVAVGMVVAAVTLSAATAAGWLEDLAARRTAWAPGRTSATGAVLAVAALAAAMVLSPASGSAARLPPSGRAVVDNAARVEAEVAAKVAGGGDEPARTVVDDLPAVLDAAGAAERERRLTDMVAGFTSRHQAELETAGATFFDLAVVTADGQEISLRWDAATGTRTVADAAELAWFSITKSATAGWLMRLAAQGVVDVDDPVGRYLPQVPHGDDITLDHLARHQSGIPGSFDSDWLTANIGEDARTWIRSGELAFDPGARHAYSRVGYTLLAWALEEASGVTWQEAMRTMASEAGAGATFVIDEERSPAGTENRHPGTGRYVGSAWAAGGLISEPLDLARFFHWLYRDGLGESSVAALSTVPVSSEFSYYGAGVMVSCPCEVDSEMVRPEFIGHGAATGFFFHHVPTGTTLAIVPQRAMDENGFIDLFFDGELALGVVDALAAPAVGTPRQSLLLRRS